MRAFIHTYVRHDGTRIPWKICDPREGFIALAKDDRIEEVTILTDDALDALKLQQVLAFIGGATEWCSTSLCAGVTQGEAATAFDLLSFLQGQAKAMEVKAA